MQQNPGRTKLRTLALMTGMGLMIPCYLFTVGNIWFLPMAAVRAQPRGHRGADGALRALGCWPRRGHRPS